MLRFTLIAAFALGLSACGFTPLYSTTGDGSAVSEGLRSVEISGIEATPDIRRLVDRELRDLLPEPSGQAPRYKLYMNLQDRRAATVVRRSAATTRFDYTLFGSYRLRDTQTGEIVHRQGISAMTSYGVVSSQYASLVGREDAVRRAAVEIARRIETDMALFLAGRPAEANEVDLPDILDVDGRFDTGAPRTGQ
ncbi:MAG: LPS assembly lipoprotein LptE [Pseudomonadota bacterium]